MRGLHAQRRRQRPKRGRRINHRVVDHEPASMASTGHSQNATAYPRSTSTDIITGVSPCYGILPSRVGVIRTLARVVSSLMTDCAVAFSGGV